MKEIKARTIANCVRAHGDCARKHSEAMDCGYVLLPLWCEFELIKFLRLVGSFASVNAEGDECNAFATTEDLTFAYWPGVNGSGEACRT